jgi:phosphatidylglycerophosphatase C
VPDAPTDPPPHAPTARPGIAAFDVDGTLTTRDCVVPFLRTVNGTAQTAFGLAQRAHRLTPALLRRDRDTVKALAGSVVFSGRSIEAVRRHGIRFADRIVTSWVRQDSLATLRQHQARGHEVVFVSASFAAYLRPLGERLGVGHVLGTELVVDGDGCCTGALDGGNCRGEEKVVRLHAWLAERYGTRAGVEVWAYGDSPGDHAMLADADHAVWMGADRKRPPGMT